MWHGRVEAKLGRESDRPVKPSWPNQDRWVITRLDKIATTSLGTDIPPLSAFAHLQGSRKLPVRTWAGSAQKREGPNDDTPLHTPVVGYFNGATVVKR